MKKILVVALLLHVLSGCSAMFEPMLPTHMLYPSISADGSKTFRFASPEKHSAYEGIPAEEVEKIRTAYLESELGQRQYCMNGYAIEKIYPQSGFIFYEGRCK